METLDINYIIKKERENEQGIINLTKKEQKTLDINYIIRKENILYGFLYLKRDISIFLFMQY